MNSVSNFKSEWTLIRSNSVLFSGYLLGHLNKEKQSQLSKEHITNGRLSFFIFSLNLIDIYLSFVKTAEGRSVGYRETKSS